MLIDISQGRNSVVVSYSNTKGEIELKNFDVKAINGIGFYDYIICDENDPAKEPKLRHFKDDLPIKKVSNWKFDFDELREFLLTVIPEEDRELIYDKQEPMLYMCDIEINIEDGDIFPDPVKAEFPIDSIQITAPNLNTVTLSCNERVKMDESQMQEIEDAINAHYKDVPFVWTITDRIRYRHIVFDTEQEMLEYWWKIVNEKVHAISFWNGNRFDVPYLNNRCAKLGVDMSNGSPTKEMSKMHDWPKHRYVFDYLPLVEKWAWDLFPLRSLALDFVVKKIFNVGKVQYEGSYKDLYHGPIVRYMAYGAVDTIGMQLMHLNKKYTAGLTSLVFYAKTSLFEGTQVTSQVHALVWDELYAENKINGEPFEKKIKKKYEGGYVKQPTRKFVMFPVGIDFSALYPRLIQSYNMSFENYLGEIRDEHHKKELIKQGYFVSSEGNYYKNDKPYTLKKIEDKLLSARYVYKDLMLKVFTECMASIEKELTSRNIPIPDMTSKKQ